MQENVKEAIEELKCRPIFATCIERITLSNKLKDLYLDLPQPIRFGKVLGEFLAGVSTPLKPYDLFAGRIVAKELTPEEEELFQQFLRSNDNIYVNTVFSHGHCTFDWENLINSGLDGVLSQIEQRKARADKPDEIDYLTGMELVINAISAFALRYAEKAENIGSARLGRVLTSIAHDKPKTFYEALQLAWIITFINCSYITGNPTLTLGRLDRILYPYYKADIESGRLTEDEARELITDYYCKHNLNMGRGEHQIGDQTNSTTFSRILNFDAPQYLLLAGTDEHDDGVVNPLTKLFMDCVVPEFKNPVIILYYFKDMEKSFPDFWKSACSKALASSSMIIYNDGNVKSSLRELGFPEDVVSCYAHYGCNWMSLGASSYVAYMGPTARKMAAIAGKPAPEDAGYDLNKLRCNTEYGLPSDFMHVMKHFAEEDSATSIDQFFDKFIASFDAHIEKRLKSQAQETQNRFLFPRAILLFGDCFNRSTIENVACSASTGVKWHFDSQGLQGFATTVDCFLAVDELCFEKKLTTVKKLYEATQKDFLGEQKLLAYAVKAEKFGNDTPKANLFAKRLLGAMIDVIVKRNKPYIEKYNITLLPTIQSDTWHYKYGVKLGATPDGRRAHTPYSQNSNAASGAKRNGLIAELASINNLPMNRLVSGAYQFDVQPKDFEGEKGLECFSGILATYLSRGGLNAQVSSVSVDSLIAAQEKPDCYRDLRVRVTGYSGIFVDVTKPLQDDIIARMK